MKKIFAFFILTVFVIATGVFAEQVSSDDSVDKFVKDVASVKGLNKSDVQEIKELDIKDLPDKVNFENIDDNNLALYQINVGNNSQPVFVITASSELIEKVDKKPILVKTAFMNFGINGEVSENTFMSSSGVQTSLKRGYVMPEDGSIVGLTSSLEILSGDNNDLVEVVIYKDSKEIGFRNSFVFNGEDVYTDYDTITSGILDFKKGDMISLELKIPEGVDAKDVLTLLEVELK